MSARKQIGTVKITRDRVYKLDPMGRDDGLATTVCVPPGTYPVYLDGMSHYWQMTGTLNHNYVRLGDGAFTMRNSDVPSEDEVVFYSMRYGPDEWADLMVEFAAMPESRLIFTLDYGEAAL